MVPAVDPLLNPLAAIGKLFSKAVHGEAGPNGIQVALAGGDCGVAAAFREALADPAVLAQVPSLNAVRPELLAPGSLVRYRGMVQDMYNPEYYVGAFRAPPQDAPPGSAAVWHTTKGRDTAGVALPTDEADVRVWERRAFYVVPVPGESAWCHEAAAAEALAAPAGRVGEHKRGREEEPAAAAAMETEEAAPAGAEEAAKRVRALLAANGTPPADGGAADPAAASLATLLNYPLLGETRPPCLVKLYDAAGAASGVPQPGTGLLGPGESPLKLNEVVEFIGVLGEPQPELVAGPDLSADRSGLSAIGSELLDEELAQQPPTSQVTRLHALLARRVGTLPATPAALDAEAAALEQLCAAAAPTVAVLREQALALLTAALGGDALAAEYTLLAALARVHARAEPLAVGKLCLNLTLPAEAAPSVAGALSGVLAALLPRTAVLPLSLESLNSRPLAPAKSYESNRLTAGSLQVADGTLLLLDETTLRPGSLGPVGVANVAALRQLAEGQTLSYDFQFYKMEMPTDVPMLVLSAGKSLLPVDAMLPLRPTAPARGPSTADLSGAFLASVRAYLAAARRLEHTMEAPVLAAVEADLVAARQADPAIGQDDFHRWLTLARLLSHSHGEPSLSEARWRQVRALEARRAERLRVC